MEPAMFSEGAGKGKAVNCKLCARLCKNIRPGGSGFCGVRRNVDGRLFSMVYGKAVSLAVDPIEKKPLFHFAPGSDCLSLATVGCNFRCLHCQNWEISQAYGEIAGHDIPPEKIVAIAKDRGVQGIAYTYTEPTVFYEYAYDTMRLAKKAGLYNVWVSNGYTTPAAIKKMGPYLHAVNVDIKGNDKFYRSVCKAPGIQPVFDALLAYKKAGVWVEVTNLVIPGYNDGQADVKQLVTWVRDNMGADTPVHFSAFYPQYKMNKVRPTPVQTLQRCYDIAKKAGLHWIYLGNVQESGHESTACWRCGSALIKRAGYDVASVSEKCGKCGTRVPLAGMKWAGK